MSNLKNQLIRLGSENPDLRPHLEPIINTIKHSTGKTASENKLRLYLFDWTQKMRRSIKKKLKEEEDVKKVKLGSGIITVKVNGKTWEISVRVDGTDEKPMGRRDKTIVTKVIKYEQGVAVDSLEFYDDATIDHITKSVARWIKGKSNPKAGDVLRGNEESTG